MCSARFVWPFLFFFHEKMNIKVERETVETVFFLRLIDFFIFILYFGISVMPHFFYVPCQTVRRPSYIDAIIFSLACHNIPFSPPHTPDGSPDSLSSSMCCMQYALTLPLQYGSRPSVNYTCLYGSPLAHWVHYSITH